MTGSFFRHADLDWNNIIEEVADVGRKTLRACQTRLIQALLQEAVG